MAEPRIQYAKTSDGVSIAYMALGEGPALIIPPAIYIGEVVPKGFEEPVRLYEVRWQEDET